MEVLSVYYMVNIVVKLLIVNIIYILWKPKKILNLQGISEENILQTFKEIINSLDKLTAFYKWFEKQHCLSK